MNSDDIHQCVCSRSVASSFAQNSSACLLHCRPRLFPRSFLQTTAMSYKSRGGQETKEWRNKSRMRPSKKNKRGRKRRSCIVTGKAIKGGSVVLLVDVVDGNVIPPLCFDI